MPEPLVLAVDDEAPILRLISLQLRADGFRVATARSAGEALESLEREPPSIALLDLVMPGVPGLDLLATIKRRLGIPIIVLSARAGESERTQALESGADLYLTKPFSPEELSGHVRRLLRARKTPPETVLRSGALEIDLAEHVVTRGAQPVSLTRTEWSLLEHLAATAGAVVPKERLLSEVWGPEHPASTRSLRVWIERLQRKLGDDPAHPSLIKTFQDGGCMLAVDALG